jgi:nicotinamide riboside kinase
MVFFTPCSFFSKVILGPMFSGKSTELVRRLKRFQVARHDCLVIKYSKDKRYDAEKLATHDKQLFPAVAAEKLYDIREQVEEHSVIGIDEGQFVSRIFMRALPKSVLSTLRPKRRYVMECFCPTVPGHRRVCPGDGESSKGGDRCGVGR